MLAQLARLAPIGAGWRYEPKLDGFRALLAHQPGGYVRLTSRNQKDLAPSFPEVLSAGSCLPAGTIVDGELVVADEQRCADFGALQARLTVPVRLTLPAAARQPAVLVAFDVLEYEGKDVSCEPLHARRRLLEALVPGRHPCLQLMTQTSDAQLARDWMSHVPAVEGVVAKRADGCYRPGRREWVKVKRQRTADCVVVGLAGHFETPALVLGLHHQDGELHLFGVTRPISNPRAKPLWVLRERAGPAERPIRSRWQHQGIENWRRVPPELVCEVRFSNLDGGRWLRQAATFLRWRDDRLPEDCSLGQLSLQPTAPR
jgi:ATP-dependent DNA ligase